MNTISVSMWWWRAGYLLLGLFTFAQPGQSYWPFPTAQLRQVSFKKSESRKASLTSSKNPTNPAGQSPCSSICACAYDLLTERVTERSAGFYVYFDQDSGYNHGVPSGFFGPNLSSIHIDTGCIDSASSPNGCSADPDVLDAVRGTVMRISFDPQTGSDFAGVNVEEPEGWGNLHTGNGYDLRGATNIVFDVRGTPGNGMVQFGVGGCVTQYMTIPSSWTTKTIELSSLTCGTIPLDLSSVHILFAVAANSIYTESGATVLLDRVRFEPVPAAHQTVPGFPLANQTFGVLPRQDRPMPPDQVLRNLTTIYESSLTELALLARGTSQDLINARAIADAFDYALQHENHGDPVPSAPDGSVALHNGYESGDLPLFNSQSAPKLGQTGDVRLAGFTSTTQCPASGFCLVLDGATGGNNAFAVLALLAAYQRLGDVRYLNDARTVGNWIVGNLSDHSETGYGGYFLGYEDQGVPAPKPLQKGKSTENNADIFAAFTALSTVESRLGNPTAAANWTAAANVAGDFVMRLFDSVKGRFNAGTVPAGTLAGPGICPKGSPQGNDDINTCDFIDANTFPALAMAAAPRYKSQIDWHRPIQYACSTFAQTVTAGGQTFSGFDIVPTPVSGANGIAWEFTGQMVEAINYLNLLYGDSTFTCDAGMFLSQMALAQASAPFADSKGIVASTLQNGNTLPPVQQCLDTPYQCIAERVGLAATIWGVFAERRQNIFVDYLPKKVRGQITSQ